MTHYGEWTMEYRYWLWHIGESDPAPWLVRLGSDLVAVAELLYPDGVWRAHDGADRGVHFGEPGFQRISADQAAPIEAAHQAA